MDVYNEVSCHHFDTLKQTHSKYNKYYEESSWRHSPAYCTGLNWRIARVEWNHCLSQSSKNTRLVAVLYINRLILGREPV